MTTEQQDAVDAAREGNVARACAWSDWRKDYGVSADQHTAELEHRAFCGGWDARGAEPTEPPRASGGVIPDPSPGLALASFIIQNVAEAHRGRDNGDMGARYAYALGRLHQEAARFIREHEQPVGGATVGKLSVTISAEMAERVQETARRMAAGLREAAVDVPGEEEGASVQGVPWWRSKPRAASDVVASVPIQRDVADALVGEFGFVPLSVRSRIARAMVPLLEAAANDGSPHRPPQDKPTVSDATAPPEPLEPFHPDGDRAARGDESEAPSPTAEDLEAWKGLRPGDVLGNVYKTASLGWEHGQTWLELMVGWDEDGAIPVPVVVTIRTTRGEWREPRVWEPRPLGPGHRRRVIAHPDLTGAPIALRHLVYPRVSGETLVLGPETLAGPERVGEHQHPRIIMYRGGTYVLGDDAPAVPGANVQTLRAAWVAGEEGLTARIGEDTYVKVRKGDVGLTREDVGLSARVPGEPRPSRWTACGYTVRVNAGRMGPCQRPSGHASATHQDVYGQTFNDRGERSPF